MFTKYLNQFGKAEAEWVQECLDLHEGDEPKARAEVIAAVERILGRSDGGYDLTPFEQSVAASCFASHSWWHVGLARLQELGRYPAANAPGVSPETESE